MGLNYQGLFERWEIAIAKKLVNEFQQNWGYLAKDGFEDLLQECLICWLVERNKYDPQREASKKTYMSRIVKYHFFSIRDKAYAVKRRCIYESDSLDEYIDPDENSPSSNKKHQPFAFNDPAISIDVSLALKKLTPEQKRICAMLHDEGISLLHISRRMKKDRNYVYREVQRIRQVFERQGLKEYLK